MTGNNIINLQEEAPYWPTEVGFVKQVENINIQCVHITEAGEGCTEIELCCKTGEVNIYIVICISSMSEYIVNEWTLIMFVGVVALCCNEVP